MDDAAYIDDQPQDCPAKTAIDASKQRPILDLTHLRRYTMGIADLEQEILTLFLDGLPQYLANLEQANTPKDWHMAAHTLKGTALAVGAGQLAAQAIAAEAGGLPAPCERDAILSALQTAKTEVDAEIRRLGLIG